MIKSLKSTTTLSLLAASAVILVTGCTNMNVRPASQGPYYYTAAHDSTEGDNCHRARRASTLNDGRYTIEDSLPQKTKVVRCLNEAENLDTPVYTKSSH